MLPLLELLPADLPPGPPGGPAAPRQPRDDVRAGDVKRLLPPEPPASPSDHLLRHHERLAVHARQHLRRLGVALDRLVRRVDRELPAQPDLEAFELQSVALREVL